MEAKGKKLLKVSGILFVIEGVIGVLAYGLMTLLLGMETLIEKSTAGGTVTAIAVLYLVASVISLVAGILGVKKGGEKASASKCLVWGVLNLVVVLAASIWSYAGEGATLAHFVYTAASLIIPSLYIAGAYMNKE